MSSNNASHGATVASGAARPDTQHHNENEAESDVTVPTTTNPSLSSDAAAVVLDNSTSVDENDAPVPPAYISAAYNKMDRGIEESIENSSITNDNALVPAAYISAAYDEMDKAIQESIQHSSIGDDDAPLPPGQIIAASHEEKENITKTVKGEVDEEIGDTVERSSGLSDNDNDVASRTIMLGDEDTAPAMQPSTASLVLGQTDNQIKSGQNPPTSSDQPIVLPVAVVTRPPAPSMSPPPSTESRPSLSSDSSSSATRMYEVPEARLVSQEVYDAELVRRTIDTTQEEEEDLSTSTGPWWKIHKRFLLIVLVIVIGFLAAIMGMGISSEDGIPPEPTNQFPTNSTFAPPIVTPPPSMAPTECALIISRQAQTLELQEYQMKSPVFAIDGVNGIFATGSGSVLFFVLSGNKMIVKNLFVYESLGARPSVAISGKTAVVGNLHGHIVYVFEQNIEKGLWEEVQDALTPPDGGVFSYFGASVGVYGNLIVVGAPTDYGFKGSMFIFRQKEGGSWQLQEKIHPESLCSRALFGMHVAIHSATVITSAACNQSIYTYHINTTSGDITPSQDVLVDVFVDSAHITNALYLGFMELGLPSAINLSTENSLFLTNATGIMVFQRPSSVEAFTFVQYIEVENFGNPYSDYNHLASQSADYVYTNLVITEDIVSDYGEGYTFSPVVDKDLFAFASGNLLHVFSQHDGFWEESMQIESNAFADGSNNATLFKGTVAISGRNLIFVTENGLTTHNLEDCTQSTPTMSPSIRQKSSAPVTATPSISPTTLNPTISPRPTAVPSLSVPPTSSLVPTAVPSKSQEPTSSTAPTKCYNIEISILLDTGPRETSWDITLVNEDSGVVNGNGLDAVVATSPEYNSDYGFWGGSEYKHDLCLREGLYEFTIYDRAGNGLCCLIIHGHYKIQLDGETIAEGGEFGYKETTKFSLP